DSPDARLLLHKILRDGGYRDTHSASSAHDAYKCLDLDHDGAGGKEIDLIVMDVKMPEIDGMEACRRIKAVEALRDIPIIMTARSQQEVLRVAFDARKNWEQELTKTISELDAAFHEMITLQQLIPILPRL